jgi:hypothetical protein
VSDTIAQICGNISDRPDGWVQQRNRNGILTLQSDAATL